MLSCVILEDARVNNATILIHCMAGISRSVTLTIAYLMAHFAMSMQEAYQFVKDKRPAISPNLNFMGQLVEFERELAQKPRPTRLDLSEYIPRPDQLDISEKLIQHITRRSNSITGLPGILEVTDSNSTMAPKTHTPSPDKESSGARPTPPSQQPFLLKPLHAPKGRRSKKFKEIKENTTSESEEWKTENGGTTQGGPFTGIDTSAPLPQATAKAIVSGIENLSVKGEQKSLHERPVSPSRSPDKKMMNEVTPIHSD